MPVHISPEPFTYIYFADVFGADKANRNPVVCTPFSLSAGDLEARRFDLDGQFFEITPGATGLPTMRDKDVWLYCVSWLANAMFDERHKDLSRNLRFTARDFLDFSKRGNGGAQYDGLAQALDRLAGSKITTNIPPPAEIKECGDSFNFIRYEAELDRDERIDAVNIELPERLYHFATEWTHVRAMHPDYFMLTPLHRLIYILAKIHCGVWQPWAVPLNKLHRLAGCSSPLRKFKNSVQELLKDNSIPEYRLEMDAQKMTVTFYRLPEDTSRLVPIPVNRSTCV